MDRIINIRMMSHPVNWLIVFTVLMFVGFAFTLASEYLNSGPSLAD